MALTRLVELQVKHQTTEFWTDIYIRDDVGNRDVFVSQPNSAGGTSFHRDTGSIFSVYWRAYERHVEVIICGMSNDVSTHRYRLNTGTSVVTSGVGLSFVASRDLLNVAFVTQVACNWLQFDLKSLHNGHVVVCTNISHSLTCDGSVLRASSRYSPDAESAMFHIMTEKGGSVLANMSRQGEYEELELRQNSLMSALRRSVLPSFARGSEDAHYPACSTFFQDRLYIITKNLHLKCWSLNKPVECTSDVNLQSLLNLQSPADYKPISLSQTRSSHSSLLLINPTTNNSQIALLSLSPPRLLAQLNAGDNDVLHHSLISDELYITWRERDGRTAIRHTNVDQISRLDTITSSDVGLRSVSLGDSAPPSPDVVPHLDPRELFCDHIFRSHRFLPEAILRAAAIFDGSLSPESPGLSLADLERITCAAVTIQVRSSVTSDDLTSLEYRDLQMVTWSKLYSNLIQYQEMYTRPLAVCGGATCDTLTPISILSQKSISYLRPCDPVEQQYLFPSDPLDPSQALDQDVVTTSQTLHFIRSCVEGFDTYIYRCLLEGKDVPDVISEISNSLLTCPNGSQLKHTLMSHVQNLPMLVESLQIFRHLLNFSVSDDQELQMQDDSAELFTEWMSQDALRFLVDAVTDVTSVRFSLLASLLVYIDYISLLSQQMGAQIELSSESRELINSFHDLLRTYTAMMWTCRLQLSGDVGTGVAESLLITNNKVVKAVLQSGSPASESLHLLEDYISGVGGLRVQGFLNIQSETPVDFNHRMSLVITATQQALWPNTPDVTFYEYLLARGASDHLATACQLVDNWCKLSISHRHFLLGQAHLISGCSVKAYASFESSLYSMFNDPHTDAMDDSGETITTRQVDMALTMVNLFEEFGFSEQLIQMAYQCIKFSTHQPQPALHTKIFKHNLDLCRYDDAYNSMLANPDSKYRSDCLHQFVSHLCERSLTETLVSYPYKQPGSQTDLRTQVIEIITNKARSVNLSLRNFYDILYSFHVLNNNMAAAAAVMYECAHRLAAELQGKPSLQKQAKCYLSMITALKCVSRKCAYITPELYLQESEGRRTLNSPDCFEREKITRIVTVEDIEKEYLLVNMSLRLAAVTQSGEQGSISRVLQPRELVKQQCIAGLYDQALEVCITFNIPLDSLFDSLAFRCIEMSRERASTKVKHSETVQWLHYNQLPVNSAYTLPEDKAWNLLRKFLEQHDKLTKYHKIVANKLLSSDFPLPEWFIASYQERNSAELLRLYMVHDKISESVSLATRYLDAMSTAHSNKYSSHDAMSGTMLGGTMWAPHLLINTLQQVLAEHHQNPHYAQMHEILSMRYEKYMEHLNDASQLVCK